MTDPKPCCGEPTCDDPACLTPGRRSLRELAAQPVLTVDPPAVPAEVRGLVERIHRDQRSPVAPDAPVVVMVSRTAPAEAPPCTAWVVPGIHERGSYRRCGKASPCPEHAPAEAPAVEGLARETAASWACGDIADEPIVGHLAAHLLPALTRAHALGAAQAAAEVASERARATAAEAELARIGRVLKSSVPEALLVLRAEERAEKAEAELAALTAASRVLARGAPVALQVVQVEARLAEVERERDTFRDSAVGYRKAWEQDSARLAEVETAARAVVEAHGCVMNAPGGPTAPILYALIERIEDLARLLGKETP